MIIGILFMAMQHFITLNVIADVGREELNKFSGNFTLVSGPSDLCPVNLEAKIIEFDNRSIGLKLYGGLPFEADTRSPLYNAFYFTDINEGEIVDNPQGSNVFHRHTTSLTDSGLLEDYKLYEEESMLRHITYLWNVTTNGRGCFEVRNLEDADDLPLVAASFTCTYDRD